MKISDVIKGTRLTEKTYQATAENKYVFNVSVDATKDDVRVAVEKLFEVEVVSVRTINVRGKLKLGGKNKRNYYRTSRYKKAIVELKSGQTISAFDEIFNEEKK